MGSKVERVFQDVTIGDLDRIRLFVRETAAADGRGAAEIEELVVAVYEAAANIVRHSYRNEPGVIKVTVVCSAEMIQVTLLDDGPAFDPTTVPTPDTTLPLEKRPFGGLGVHMMRTFCDELSYRGGLDGGNELILLKRLEP